MKRLVILIMIMALLFQMDAQAISKHEIFAGNQLRILGILKGMPDGSLQLEEKISRAQVATIMVRILDKAPIQNQEKKVFRDVKKDHWANDYINKAYQIGIIQGYLDNSFKPENNISYAEVVAIMVNVLGKKEELSPDLKWPENYLSKARELGIILPGEEPEANREISRGQMAVIVWDTLLVKIK